MKILFRNRQKYVFKLQIIYKIVSDEVCFANKMDFIPFSDILISHWALHWICSGKKLQCLKLVLFVDQIKLDMGLECWPIFMSLIAAVYFNFLQMYYWNG